MSEYTCEKKEMIEDVIEEISKITVQENEISSSKVIKVKKKKQATNSVLEKLHVLQEEKIPKPILKWVGGKTQILDTLLKEFPQEMNHYHEIFLGGGSVLLGLLSHMKKGNIRVHGKVYAYDLNEPLIHMYKNIQSHHEELYHEIQQYIEDFYSCREEAVNRQPQNKEEATCNRENYYYWIRRIYNSLSPEETNSPRGSAMFVFLNKT
jgi:DNA adenine methylase